MPALPAIVVSNVELLLGSARSIAPISRRQIRIVIGPTGAQRPFRGRSGPDAGLQYVDSSLLPPGAPSTPVDVVRYCRARYPGARAGPRAHSGEGAMQLQRHSLTAATRG